MYFNYKYKWIQVDTYSAVIININHWIFIITSKEKSIEKIKKKYIMIQYYCLFFMYRRKIFLSRKLC